MFLKNSHAYHSMLKLESELAALESEPEVSDEDIEKWALTFNEVLK